MQTPIKFWDKLADKYSKQPIKDVASYEAALARTKSYLKPEHQALEIGCGTGSTALLLAGNVKRLVASDVSGKMLEFGQAKAKAQNVLNVDFLQGDVFDDRLAPQSFDVVMAHNVLHLIENLPQAMSRISELLKPEGLFISKTPCLGDKSSMLKIMVMVMKALGKAPYVAFVKGESLEEMMQDEGFQIIEKGQYPQNSYSHYFVAKKV